MRALLINVFAFQSCESCLELTEVSVKICSCDYSVTLTRPVRGHRYGKIEICCNPSIDKAMWQASADKR
jgi:hypothetical protein